MSDKVTSIYDDQAASLKDLKALQVELQGRIRDVLEMQLGGLEERLYTRMDRLEQRVGEMERLETLMVDINRQVKTLTQAPGMTPSRRRNATSAYEPLRHHLSNLDGAAVTLSFWEVQKILNRSLPRSAFTTRAWWSNERTHTQARYGWLAAGWRVTGVNMNGLSVTFESGPV